MNRLFLLLCVACVSNVLSRTAGATESPPAGTFHFIMENDLFYNRDRHYTSGLLFSWSPEESAELWKGTRKWFGLLPWISKNAGIRDSYSLGQSIFTPRDIYHDNPPTVDRPYAGWLYGALHFDMQSGKHSDQIGLTVGVVGPASFAEQSQKTCHLFLRADVPPGWSTQIENEPGVVLSYQHDRQIISSTLSSGNDLEVSLHAGMALGNVFTYANSGATFTYGSRGWGGFSPPRIQPGRLDRFFGDAPAGFNWKFILGAEARVVARNIFLDGNTFRDSRSVGKKPLVVDVHFGWSLGWDRIVLSFANVLRSPEVGTQKKCDLFGSIGLSVQF
ncbi:lipid A deacylase LpxR family protein [Myxococcota bacterium]|nr:lipid A deacylase LpxR family protein [Myxococcota bacterium]MBU1413913.1 lipid A deacylase LpxR family protein [Myxococcota bacterium]MBU1512397.1 lipid A deacylase LpxR family protein [Myxococcota bacterium]